MNQIYQCDLFTVANPEFSFFSRLPNELQLSSLYYLSPEQLFNKGMPFVSKHLALLANQVLFRVNNTEFYPYQTQRLIGWSKIPQMRLINAAEIPSNYDIFRSLQAPAFSFERIIYGLSIIAHKNNLNTSRVDYLIESFLQQKEIMPAFVIHLMTERQINAYCDFFISSCSAAPSRYSNEALIDLLTFSAKLHEPQINQLLMITLARSSTFIPSQLINLRSMLIMLQDKLKEETVSQVFDAVERNPGVISAAYITLLTGLYPILDKDRQERFIDWITQLDIANQYLARLKLINLPFIIKDIHNERVARCIDYAVNHLNYEYLNCRSLRFENYLTQTAIEFIPQIMPHMTEQQITTAINFLIAVFEHTNTFPVSSIINLYQKLKERSIDGRPSPEYISRVIQSITSEAEALETHALRKLSLFIDQLSQEQRAVSMLQIKNIILAHQQETLIPDVKTQALDTLNAFGSDIESRTLVKTLQPVLMKLLRGQNLLASARDNHRMSLAIFRLMLTHLELLSEVAITELIINLMYLYNPYNPSSYNQVTAECSNLLGRLSNSRISNLIVDIIRTATPSASILFLTELTQFNLDEKDLNTIYENLISSLMETTEARVAFLISLGKLFHQVSSAQQDILLDKFISIFIKSNEYENEYAQNTLVVVFDRLNQQQKAHCFEQLLTQCTVSNLNHTLKSLIALTEKLSVAQRSALAKQITEWTQHPMRLKSMSALNVYGFLTMNYPDLMAKFSPNPNPNIELTEAQMGCSIITELHSVVSQFLFSPVEDCTSEISTSSRAISQDF